MTFEQRWPRDGGKIQIWVLEMGNGRYRSEQEGGKVRGAQGGVAQMPQDPGVKK